MEDMQRLFKDLNHRIDQIEKLSHDTIYQQKSNKQSLSERSSKHKAQMTILREEIATIKKDLHLLHKALHALGRELKKYATKQDVGEVEELAKAHPYEQYLPRRRLVPTFEHYADKKYLKSKTLTSVLKRTEAKSGAFSQNR